MARADYVTDFLEVGLPSTVVPTADYERALRELLAKVAATGPDVVVAEAGASPLEPYNGETALRLLAPHLRMLVVCASDPYAVAGVVDAFERRPDLVSGRAASTDAGIALVERLTGLVALNVLVQGSEKVLDRMLRSGSGSNPNEPAAAGRRRGRRMRSPRLEPPRWPSRRPPNLVSVVQLPVRPLTSGVSPASAVAAITDRTAHATGGRDQTDPGRA